MQSKVHESKGIDFSQPEKIKLNEEGILREVLVTKISICFIVSGSKRTHTFHVLKTFFFRVIINRNFKVKQQST